MTDKRQTPESIAGICSKCKIRPRYQMRSKKPPSWCKTCLAQAVREYRSTPRGFILTKSQDLKKLYGDEAKKVFDELMARQNGCCAICGRGPETQGRKRHLSVDHDHVTGEIRGLLCDTCNRGIGFLRDNPTLLFKAAEYLERH